MKTNITYVAFATLALLMVGGCGSETTTATEPTVTEKSSSESNPLTTTAVVNPSKDPVATSASGNGSLEGLQTTTTHDASLEGLIQEENVSQDKDPLENNESNVSGDPVK